MAGKQGEVNSMGIMKMDVNVVFFILIIATVLSFAGFTAYYQSSFKNISNEYTAQLAELNQVTKDLTEKKAMLTQTSQDINLTRRKVEEKEGILEEFRSKNENLEEERSLLKDELIQTKNSLAKTSSDLGVAQAQVAAQQIRIVNLESDVESYRSKRDACRAEAARLGGNC